MYPELFSIGNFTIYTYGLFVAVGFFAGMQYVVKYSTNIMSKQQVYDFLFYVILLGVIGARILYVLINAEYFLYKPFDIIKIWNGGLVYYGGFIAVIIFSSIYCKVKKINMAALVDIFSPAVALGHFFGRIGCFFSGCCYGKECDFLFPIVNKHPTQIYEAAGNLLIFFTLNSLLKKEHKQGFIFILYLLMYSVLRFIIEFFRGDDRGVFFLGLSIAQNISIIIFIVVILTITYKMRSKK